MKNYDVIVIGSGSANIVIDEAISHGKKCALIEMGKCGGTCLTRGCIPTKVMVSVADFIRQAKHVEKIGLKIHDIDVNFDLIKQRVEKKINLESNEVYEYYASQKNVDVYKATAKFVSNKEIKVIYNDKSKGEEIITGQLIIIGAGARTKIPKIEGMEEVKYITSESFFGDKFPNKPYKSLTVIGGGYIGMEFAHIFSALGSEVNVVQHNKYILPKEEREISTKALEIFSSYGINIFTNKDTIRMYEEDGLKVLEFKDITTGEVQSVKSEEIIVCPGVKSNADLLDIENTDISLKNGYIRTNEFLETTVPDVYAIGDINGMYQFRHKANYEAETLSHNLFDAKLKKENEESTNKNHEFVYYDTVPAVTYTFPQVAHVGLTEKEALEKGYEIKIAKHFYSQTAKGYSLGYDAGDLNDGFIKIIIDKNDETILGVHIIGEEASLLLQAYVELMNSGIKTLKVMNEDITSRITDIYRKDENYYISRKSNTLELTNNTMVSHPSLSEVSMWTRYMEFKDVVK